MKRVGIPSECDYPSKSKVIVKDNAKSKSKVEVRSKNRKWSNREAHQPVQEHWAVAGTGLIRSSNRLKCANGLTCVHSCKEQTASPTYTRALASHKHNGKGQIRNGNDL